MYRALSLFISLAFVGFAVPAFAQDPVPLHVFVREGCPHCENFKSFAAASRALEPIYHDIAEEDARELFTRLQERIPTLQQVVPTIVIDGRIVQGFDAAETTGRRIEKLVWRCVEKEEGCLTMERFLAGEGEGTVTAGGATCGETCDAFETMFHFNLWFIGDVDLRDYSLPVISLLLGFLDGFNPCAMWVLITLLTLLISTRDWRKIWVIGGIFLFVSSAMYYLFIAAWLNVFLLIGLNAWVQKIIGLVAIGGGGFYLFEAFGKGPSVCKVTKREGRRKTVARMRRIVEAAEWPAMILGVAVLAVSVSAVELVCTAGLPVVFTEILAFNPLTHLERYFYMFLYILMYMLDDVVIFGIAVATLHATGLTTRYQRFMFVFGGALMLVLGVLLIFNPDALMVG
jgi:glutaredoxin